MNTQHQNPLKDKSYEFALKIIKLSRQLHDDSKEFILANQILKSGTSIGANVEEALGNQSVRDFQSKMSIAYKEARETDYWLRLLKDSDTISTEVYNDYNQALTELLKMLGSIQKTMKSKM